MGLPMTYETVHDVGMTQSMTIPTWTRGDRLAKARRTAGYTGTAMARRLHVHPNTVNNWENDRVEMPYSALIAWSTITGVDVEWLEGDNPTEATAIAGYPFPQWLIPMPRAS